MKNKLLPSLIVMMFLAVVGFVSVPALATAASQPLVSTEWLQKNIGDKNLVIIDVRTTTNYGVGHIPGSYNMPYIGWELLDLKRKCQLMITPDDLTEMLQAIGVNSSTHVVIYDHGNSLSDASKGTATLWILEAVGKANVSYLNGGFTKWTFEGRIIDNVTPEPKDGDFVAKIDSGRVVSMDYVEAKSKKNAAVIVDARASGQHFGTSKRGDVPRFGHIPGSLSLPASYLNNAGANRSPATIRDKEQLAAMVLGVGIPSDKNKEIIVYCNTGQWASMDYFVLRDILGYKNVRVYDGSMLEYGAEDGPTLEKFVWGRATR